GTVAPSVRKPVSYFAANRQLDSGQPRRSGDAAAERAIGAVGAFERVVHPAGPGTGLRRVERAAGRLRADTARRAHGFDVRRAAGHLQFGGAAADDAAHRTEK